MKEIILGTLAVITVIVTLALCRLSGQVDESLEHPERIHIKEDK